MDADKHDLASTVAVIDPGLGSTLLPITPGLYAELDARFDNFRGHLLVAQHDFDADWPTWECHPAGDELVILLSGSAAMVLRGAEGDRKLTLARPGEFLRVPAGTWHTARIQQPTRMLFITPGEGTDNRGTPP